VIKVYFLDTYALIEIYRKNKNYEKYKDGQFIISYLNLIEFDYYLLKNNLDRSIFYKLKEFVTQVTDEDVKKANELKLKHKDRDVSFIDCLGYTIAGRLKIKFVTGDKEFEGLDNVEFVK